MKTKVNIAELTGKLVYVKPVAVADLSDELQAQAGTLKTIFSVHDAEGKQLALVADQAMAFALARQHDMRPVTVH